MWKGARIAVVIPAYNEARLITRTLGSIPHYVDLIVVVDDGSTDNTRVLAESFRDARISVMQHSKNRGVGAAIVTGYKIAFLRGADAVAVMAGDAQMDPHDLERLLDPVVSGRAHYAKGNRLDHPTAKKTFPPLRWLGNYVFSIATRWITGLRIIDSQCGYTVLSKSAALRLPLSALWPGYGYTNDLLGHIALRQLQIEDVVVRPVYGEETSGLSVRHVLWCIPFVLARIGWRRTMYALARN